MARNRPVTLKSTITCPKCGAEHRETMPTDACQFFYECAGCGEDFTSHRLFDAHVLTRRASPSSTA